jgi:uncharacterized protein YjbI with pentapeptide repeats
MANPEHIEILTQGVEKWNQWRMDNPDIIPDLSGATVNDLLHKLKGMNFANANFYKAHFTHWFCADGADLQNADFSHTEFDEGLSLQNANLHNANFSESSLGYFPMFDRSNLDLADFHSAKMQNASFSESSLRQANFNKATFSYHALLTGSDLSSANFVEASLPAVQCYKANFSNADLSYAKMWSANLQSANLSQAKLQNTILPAACLIHTILDKADLTGSVLWETQRAGWSVKGVICDYVYWDEKGKEKSVYNPGEFERLFADKTKVRLFFKGGISPLEVATIPALIKHLEESHHGTGLRLVSIKEDSGGVVAELAIEGADNKTPEQLQQLKTILEAEAQQRVQYQKQALLERDARLQLEGGVKQLSSVVEMLIHRQSIIVNQGGVTMGKETYQNYGQTAGMGQNVHAHDMTFNQIVNNFEKSIDLPTLAKQLGELREEMAKRQDSSPQTAIAQGEIAKAEIAAKEGNTSKVVEHLKVGGEWLLDIAKETGKELLTSAIKASMGMQ